MRTRWALLAVGVLAACGSRDSETAGRSHAEPSPPRVAPAVVPPPPNAKESHVFDVKSSDDLLPLRTEYQRLWDAGFDGTFEVNIASGAYPAFGWDLAPASDSPRRAAAATIDVVLRGGPAAPPVPSLVRARNLHIEGLVLASRGSPWELQVSGSLTIKRSMMIDARARKWDRGPLLAILGRGDEGARKPTAVTARIESSWFVRNWQGGSSASMIGFGSVKTAPTYWDTITIDDCAFVGNAFSVSLDFEFAKAVSITRSLFYKPWAAGVLIKSTSSGDIVVDDSVIITESIDHVAAKGDESPPIKLGTGSRVYVNGWTAGGAVPPSLAVDPGQIHDRAALAGGEAALTEATKLPADALPPVDLKATLDAAARP
jgi:hypothetical protein